MNYNYIQMYNKSITELEKYIKINKKIPNEQEWNKYAVINGLLSSKSIQYEYGLNFNKICRKLTKIINKKKKLI